MALRNQSDSTEIVSVADRDEFNVITSLSDDTQLSSWDDALALFAEAELEVTSTDDLVVDEFPEIDKAKLVNRECLFIFWTRSRPESESFGQPYVMVKGITRDGTKFRFSDGSLKSGLAAQLVTIWKDRVAAGHPAPNAGLHLPRGLTASTYKTTNTVNGVQVTTDATTYYIAPAV